MTPQTILVADDEAGVRQLVCTALKMIGYSVLEASDGLAALKLAFQYPAPINLLLTDIRMPGLDGPALCRLIGEKRSETRFMLMSGYADLGFDLDIPLLQKPFHIQRLLQSVKQALEGSLADCVPAG